MKALLMSHVGKNSLPLTPKISFDDQLFLVTFFQLSQLSLPFTFIQLLHL